MEFLTAEIAGQLLLVMAIFWVAYWLLRIFLFRPVYDLLEERRSEVRNAAVVHREALAETEAELDRQRARLTEARAQARQRRDDLRRDAQAQRQALLAEAKQAAESQLREAGAELQAQVVAARSQLESQADSLAAEMTSRLLERAS